MTTTAPTYGWLTLSPKGRRLITEDETSTVNAKVRTDGRREGELIVTVYHGGKWRHIALSNENVVVATTSGVLNKDSYAALQRELDLL